MAVRNENIGAFDVTMENGPGVEGMEALDDVGGGFPDLSFRKMAEFLPI